MNVAWGLRWRESRGTKPCVFPCKVAAAGDERYSYLVCAAVAGAIVSTSNRFLLCVLQRVVVHVYVALLRLLTFWMQIAVKWLHECFHAVLPCA